MWLLIVPILILLVLGLVGSLFAGIFWLLGNLWPWLLIGLGAWLLWHQDGRHYRRRQQSRNTAWWGRTESASVQQSIGKPKVDKPKVDKSQPRPLRPNELPVDVQVKVEQIRRKVDVLLGYADRFPPFSQDLYLVRQTASDYLPRTVDAYLALPPENVDKPLNPTGKTARQELRAQLDLLDSKLDEIAQDLQRQDANRLLANRRFLEDRFGNRQAPEPITPVAEPIAPVA